MPSRAAAQMNSLESRAVRLRPRVHLTATVLPLGARAQEGQVPRWQVTLKRVDAEPLLCGPWEGEGHLCEAPEKSGVAEVASHFQMLHLR